MKPRSLLAGATLLAFLATQGIRPPPALALRPSVEGVQSGLEEKLTGPEESIEANWQRTGGELRLVLGVLDRLFSKAAIEKKSKSSGRRKKPPEVEILVELKSIQNSLQTLQSLFENPLVQPIADRERVDELLQAAQGFIQNAWNDINRLDNRFRSLFFEELLFLSSDQPIYQRMLFYSGKGGWKEVQEKLDQNRLDSPFAVAAGLPAGQAGLEERHIDRLRKLIAEDGVVPLLLKRHGIPLEFDRGISQQHLVKGLSNEWWIHLHFFNPSDLLSNGLLFRLRISPEGEILGVDTPLIEPNAGDGFKQFVHFDTLDGVSSEKSRDLLAELSSRAYELIRTQKNELEAAIQAGVADYALARVVDPPEEQGQYLMVRIRDDYSGAMVNPPLTLRLSRRRTLHFERLDQSAAGLEEKGRLGYHLHRLQGEDLQGKIKAAEAILNGSISQPYFKMTDAVLDIAWAEFQKAEDINLQRELLTLILYAGLHRPDVQQFLVRFLESPSNNTEQTVGALRGLLFFLEERSGSLSPAFKKFLPDLMDRLLRFISIQASNPTFIGIGLFFLPIEEIVSPDRGIPLMDQALFDRLGGFELFDRLIKDDHADPYIRWQAAKLLWKTGLIREDDLIELEQNHSRSLDLKIERETANQTAQLTTEQMGRLYLRILDPEKGVTPEELLAGFLQEGKRILFVVPEDSYGLWEEIVDDILRLSQNKEAPLTHLALPFRSSVKADFGRFLEGETPPSILFEIGEHFDSSVGWRWSEDWLNNPSAWTDEERGIMDAFMADDVIPFRNATQRLQGRVKFLFFGSEYRGSDRGEIEFDTEVNNLLLAQRDPSARILVYADPTSGPYTRADLTDELDKKRERSIAVAVAGRIGANRVATVSQEKQESWENRREDGLGGFVDRFPILSSFGLRLGDTELDPLKFHGLYAETYGDAWDAIIYRKSRDRGDGDSDSFDEPEPSLGVTPQWTEIPDATVLNATGLEEPPWPPATGREQGLLELPAEVQTVLRNAPNKFDARAIALAHYLGMPESRISLSAGRSRHLIASWKYYGGNQPTPETVQNVSAVLRVFPSVLLALQSEGEFLRPGPPEQRIRRDMLLQGLNIDELGQLVGLSSAKLAISRNAPGLTRRRIFDIAYAMNRPPVMYETGFQPRTKLFEGPLREKAFRNAISRNLREQAERLHEALVRAMRNLAANSFQNLTPDEVNEWEGQIERNKEIHYPGLALRLLSAYPETLEIPVHYGMISVDLRDWLVAGAPSDPFREEELARRLIIAYRELDQLFTLEEEYRKRKQEKDPVARLRPGPRYSQRMTGRTLYLWDLMDRFINRERLLVLANEAPINYQPLRKRVILNRYPEQVILRKQQRFRDLKNLFEEEAGPRGKLPFTDRAIWNIVWENSESPAAALRDILKWSMQIEKLASAAWVRAISPRNTPMSSEAFARQIVWAVPSRGELYVGRVGHRVAALKLASANPKTNALLLQAEKFPALAPNVLDLTGSGNTDFQKSMDFLNRVFAWLEVLKKENRFVQKFRSLPDPTDQEAFRRFQEEENGPLAFVEEITRALSRGVPTPVLSKDNLDAYTKGIAESIAAGMEEHWPGFLHPEELARGLMLILEPIAFRIREKNFALSEGATAKQLVESLREVLRVNPGVLLDVLEVSKWDYLLQHLPKMLSARPGFSNEGLPRGYELLKRLNAVLFFAFSTSTLWQKGTLRPEMSSREMADEVLKELFHQTLEGIGERESPNTSAVSIVSGLNRYLSSDKQKALVYAVLEVLRNSPPNAAGVEELTPEEQEQIRGKIRKSAEQFGIPIPENADILLFITRGTPGVAPRVTSEVLGQISRELGLSRTYVRIPYLIEDGNLPEFLKILGWMKQGFSVDGHSVLAATAGFPFKEAGTALVDDRDPAFADFPGTEFFARMPSGRLWGTLIDEGALADWFEDAVHPLEGRLVVVLGVGGVGASLVRELIRRKVGRIVISDPIRERVDGVLQSVRTLGVPIAAVEPDDFTAGIISESLHQELADADIVFNLSTRGRLQVDGPVSPVLDQDLRYKDGAVLVDANFFLQKENFLTQAQQVNRNVRIEDGTGLTTYSNAEIIRVLLKVIAGVDVDKQDILRRVYAANVLEGLFPNQATAGLEEAVEKLARDWVGAAWRASGAASGGVKVKKQAQEAILALADREVLKNLLQDAFRSDHLYPGQAWVLSRSFLLGRGPDQELFRIHSNGDTGKITIQVPGKKEVKRPLPKKGFLSLSKDLDRVQLVDEQTGANWIALYDYLERRGVLQDEIETENPSALLQKAGRPPRLWHFPATSRNRLASFSEVIEDIFFDSIPFHLLQEQAAGGELKVFSHVHSGDTTLSPADVIAMAENRLTVPWLLLNEGTFRGYLYVPLAEGRIQDASAYFHHLSAIQILSGGSDSYEHLPENQRLDILRSYFLVVPIDLGALASAQRLSLPGSAAGLEEGRVQNRLEAMAVLDEAVQGPGVVVIGAEALEMGPALETLVRRVPRELLERMVFYAVGDPWADRLRKLNPGVQVFPQENLSDLALLLLSKSPAERVTVLGDARVAAGLEQILPASMSVVLLESGAALRLVLAAMGIPERVLDQINASGLEELFAQAVAA